MGIFQGLNLNDAVRVQYGSGFAVCNGLHLYDWATNAGKPIDMRWAAFSQYGEGYSECALGVKNIDWKAWPHKTLSGFVVPVLQIPSSLFRDIPNVTTAIKNFQMTVDVATEFYRLNLGKTFKSLPVIVKEVGATVDQWYDLAQQSLNDATRYNYMNHAKDLLYKGFGNYTNPNLIYVVTQFCGLNPDRVAKKISPFGAANTANICVVPATACMEERTITDLEHDMSAFYAVTHELGHAFGLYHPDQLAESLRPYNWQYSIMQWGWNNLPNPVLLDNEKAKLLQSPFFA